jgi:tripartite-type tricarboxylate transporter receptor subunit TctC
MKKSRVRFMVMSLVFFIGVSSCFAANFPRKSINFIIQASAGGAADMTARTLANIMDKKLKVPIICTNKPGAAGSVAMMYLRNCKPDGYTIGIVPVELSMVKALGYCDVVPSDLDLLVRTATFPAAVAVKKDSPFNTLDDLIKYAKENPMKLKTGNSGTGSIWHIAAIALENAADIKLNHVPFDGAAAAVAALMGGHLDMVTVSPGELKSSVDGGLLKVLAVMGDERTNVFPQVKTAVELGYHDLDVLVWMGVAAPKNLPSKVKKVLVEALKEAIHSEAFLTFCKNRGMTPGYLSPEQFTKFANDQFNFYTKLIGKTNIRSQK